MDALPLQVFANPKYILRLNVDHAIREHLHAVVRFVKPLEDKRLLGAILAKV